MKFPVDVPPIRKALGIALVAAVAYVIVEGTGIGAPARQFVGAVTLQVKRGAKRRSEDRHYVVWLADSRTTVDRGSMGMALAEAAEKAKTPEGIRRLDILLYEKSVPR